MPTRTHVILVRHWREITRNGNTARLAHAALPNSRMLDWAVRDHPLDDTPLRAPDSWLLFPPALDHYGNPAPDSPPEFELGSGPPPPVRQLVVLDGSWNQARRMSHRIPAAAVLPRLTLPGPAAAAHRVRKAPGKPFRATLEALAEALEFLEGPAVSEPLHELFALFAERALRQGNKYPHPPSSLSHPGR